ncbi:purine and uridine phosphorylase [Lentithecium fluviatile CBS 122367]|uniref:Purine and uridine phosphorylase n=1 Tax=Lentithecium fluviatile CBS 122367 TaxID=1168545 RepID=A0A6G1IM18_9PLEO|nr:purine and uridine phosphorylase [Lentithecium fluviatile CBS 122367]
MSDIMNYTVGWICAIPTEYVAAQAFLDEVHEGPQYLSPHDNNEYVLGRIGKHYIVIAVMPDVEYGTSSAASVARDMLRSFPNIRVGLVVGIGGGAPSPKHDIRLGDIVVSAPRGGNGGMFQYDFGKTIQDQRFRSTGSLNQPPTSLRTAVASLKAQYEINGHQLEEAINSIFERKPSLRKNYQRPDLSSDRLYQNTVTHCPKSEANCAEVCGDDPSKMILRPKRTEGEDNPTIHYGLIASGIQVMKDASIRDALARERDVLCFEMEAAGLMNHFPCLVVRGICDYSDSHRDKEWRGYAAMTAAAYTKDLLHEIPPRRVEDEKMISSIMAGFYKHINWNPEVYTIGWICAIGTEYVAAQSFLDEKHNGPQYLSPHDNNQYILGRMGKHYIVIAVMPDGEYGTSSAASVARDMLRSFPNIRVGLMVGIGGGAPSPKHDIRLGDIVVSAPRGGNGGVFQYDFGKTIQDQRFQSAGFLNQSPPVLRMAVIGLQAQYETEGHQLEKVINSILDKKPRLRKKYSRPDPSSDRLYQSTFIHPNKEPDCATVCSNDPSSLIQRPERTEDEDNPTIHYGLIASGNQVMKDASIRDALAREKDVLCFEMEAAGLMNHFPCLVVRGICDYSDSHKNKEWQGYAAMAAAVYTKDLLYRIPASRVEEEKRISDIVSAD